MTGSIEELFGAVMLFVGSHFVLAALSVRNRLVSFTGERGFLLAFSVVSLAAFALMLKAYGAAPIIIIWSVPDWALWVPNIALPIACVLAVCGLTIQSPTSVEGERFLDDAHAPRGILTVTRHPFLWGTGLWALSHLPANGTAADILLFGGMAVLSFVGMGAIDAKRRERLGGAWGPFELTTSILPFHAILDGRTKFDWSGIGVWRIALGLVVWAALYYVHPWIAGADPMPVW
jgi:uncharacterized membrane protein